VRIPAAFCGVFAHKPTYGVVPKPGAVPADLSVRGPMARSAADLRLLMEVTAGAHSDAWLPVGGSESWTLALLAIGGRVI
jgi:amidase